MIENSEQLGLCDPPDPVYLFVGGDKTISGDVFLWYKWNHGADAQDPVFQNALRGRLKGLRVFMKPFKDKLYAKVDIHIAADRPYVIRSGADTSFTRGLILALESVGDLKEPLYFVVAPGDEAKVVFGHAYSNNGERVKVEWDADKKLFPVIQALQGRLGQAVQTIDDVRKTGEQYKETAGSGDPLKQQQAPPPQQTQQSRPPQTQQRQPQQQQKPSSMIDDITSEDVAAHPDDDVPF